MSDYVVSELINKINTVIYNPIQLTQRIKYVSYDVSQQFIVFGANSGGLYIFQRYPCTFIKLVPNTGGSVIYTCISPDEKTIAIGTSKGNICLVDNSNGNTRDIQVYNGHQGNSITAMIWNKTSTELFIGDNIGKLSVVIPQSFITKTMFQIPCSTIMQVDSNIVQLDMCSQFLLVSTLTRCYLCDTEKEQYRQIGQKLRDGDFGACFHGSQPASIPSNEKLTALSAFRILSDKESFMNYDGMENLKIFCARPGSRIWEVQIDGTVIRTHQFKQALTVAPSDIVPFAEDCDTRFMLNQNASPIKGQSLNFKKLYMLNGLFIVTFKKDGLYVFNPVNASLIFWTDVYKDILDVKVVKNFIYLWTLQKKMHVLFLSNLENIITKCLLSDKYLLCADLCILYEKQILQQVTSSRKLRLLSNLDEKLKERQESKLSSKLENFFNKIKEYTEEKQSAQKMNCGIYVVDNAHYLNNSLEDSTVAILPSSKTTNVKHTLKTPNNNVLEVMHTQFEMEKINKLYSSKALYDILENCSNFAEVCSIFKNFDDNLENNLNQEKYIWCCDTFLKYLSTKNFSKIISQLDSNSDSALFVFDAFQTLNLSVSQSCECGYPLPGASQKRPKYCDIGCCIFDRYPERRKELCRGVPYMWNRYLELKEALDVAALLPLVVQLANQSVLEAFSGRLTYDLWNDALKLFVSLNRGRCLNCERRMEQILGQEAWLMFAVEMIKSIGAESAVELLLQHAGDIPPSVFDAEFYQTAIFSCVVDNFQGNLRKNSVDLVKRVYENQKNIVFGNMLEKHLCNQESSSSTKILGSGIKNENCLFCKMPLRTIPVLVREHVVVLQCGHAFHNLCGSIANNRCTDCNETID